MATEVNIKGAFGAVKSESGYISSRADVISSRNKFAKANDDFLSAKRNFDNVTESDKNYKKYADALAIAKRKLDAAKAERAGVESRAKEDYKQAKAKLEEGKKKEEAKTLEQEITGAELELKRLEDSGQDTTAQQEKIDKLNAKKLGTAQSGGELGAQKDGKGVVDVVGTANKQLAKLAESKDATNFIKNRMTDSDRLNLAKSLKEAGYDVIETGMYNSNLVQQYQSALTDAQSENTFNKDVTGYQPFNLQSYLSYRTSLVNAGKDGKPKTTFAITELTDVDAAAYIERTFDNELGRKPTAAELKALVPAMKAYVRATPTKRTSGDRTRIETSGPNPVDWLTQTIRGQQQIIGFSKNNKKQEDRAKKVIGKLSQELTTKQGQTLANFSEDILSTVKNNGLSKVINQSQIQGWARRLANGEKLDTINREIRNIAKVGMPDSVKTLMDSGIDLDTIYSPYKKAMATVLEINPETISLDDSILRKAIGPTGEMPIYDFERALRQDGRWQYTNNAKKEVSDAALRVLRDFGFQG